MIWLYLLGMGLNATGFQWFVRMLGPMDRTPVLSGFQIASGIGGIIFFILGFFLFQWWIPLAAMLLAPAVIGLALGQTSLRRFPQLLIISGLSLIFISVVVSL